MQIGTQAATMGEGRAPGGPSNGRLALVLGITGGIGGATAAALAADGWRIRAMARDPGSAARRAAIAHPVEWVAGDALVPADVAAAARGAALIVHGVNPPGYRNWRGLALPMLANSIAAAKAAGARIVLPGNVYNFGPDAGAMPDEQAPQRPLTRKGRVRVEMEAMLRAATAEGVRTLVVRAGDFFGPGGASSWFAQVLVKGGRAAKSVTYPGSPDAGHAWAYLPDMAGTIARLVAQEERLAPFEVFHFGGHWFKRGIAMAEAAQQALGQPVRPIRRFPWILVYLGAPFMTFLRELIEMRYLWQRPLRLDNRKLVAFLGAEPHTPLAEALAATLGPVAATRPPITRG